MSIADELAKLDDLRAKGILTPEEFQAAKSRLLGGAVPAPEPLAALNRFRRATKDRWLGGVCGGLATATGLESWVWRLIFAVLLLFGGTGFVLYLLLWIFVPAE